MSMQEKSSMLLKGDSEYRQTHLLNMLLMDITEEVCQRMEESSITREELGEYLNWPKEVVDSWLDGDESTSLSEVVKILSYFDRQVVLKSKRIRYD